jgi:hypothetical protein
MFDFLDSSFLDVKDEHAESSEDELYQYLNMKPKRLEHNADLLSWWCKHEKDFPRLAPIACDVLAIPGVLSHYTDLAWLITVNRGLSSS